ncbi:MAG: hypothetical protein JOZ39_12765 [Chloroflexi bacterium]|nr:hypothetical protein [Chloroflexota bacterium]
MPPELAISDALAELESQSRRIISAVTSSERGAALARKEMEGLVLSGLDLAIQASNRLTQMLDSAQTAGQDVEPISEMLGIAEQKLAFFLGCTMRRSALTSRDTDAERCAAEAEQLAGQVTTNPRLDLLVEAYKRLERIEGEIVALRGAGAGGGSTPEPRVLDLPRTRVLAARRRVGGAVTALDSDDED